MTVRTNRCKHCGKPKEEHWELIIPSLNDDDNFYSQNGNGANCYPNDDSPGFYDTGTYLLTKHQEELYEAAAEVVKLWRDDNETTMLKIDSALIKLDSILTLITNEPRSKSKD